MHVRPSVFSRVWINRYGCRSCSWSAKQREMNSLSPFVPKQLASRDRFGRPLCINSLITHGILTVFRDGAYLYATVTRSWARLCSQSFVIYPECTVTLLSNINIFLPCYVSASTFNMPTLYQLWVWEREARINLSMVIPITGTILRLSGPVLVDFR